MIDQLALGSIVFLLASGLAIAAVLGLKSMLLPSKKKQDGVNSGAKFG